MRKIKVKSPAKTPLALGEQSEALEMRRPEIVSGSHGLRVKCPAKINLTLEILNKREDGFHNIQSVMQTINLFDILTIEVEESDKFEIKLSGTSDEIPYDGSNLVHKAIEKFMNALVLSPPEGEGGWKPHEGFIKLIEQRAKKLRKDLTLPEEILWYHLSDRRFCDLKFRRQVPFKQYIADFTCYEKKIIIELDGSGHLDEKNKKHDKKRDEFFINQGFKVLRFYNTDIFNNIENVLEKIYQETTPHPHPLSHKGRGVILTPKADEQCLLPPVGEGGWKPDEGMNYKISIHIEKNIPISAGLAGGSTNAAGAIWGLNELLGQPLNRKQLHEICASLGSDLNFCLEGGCQLTTGRGEVLEKLPFIEFDVSLIKPKNLGISAKEAYTKFAELENKPNLNMTEKLVNALQSDEKNIEKYITNDLELAVFEDYKELQTIKQNVANSIMSGSGSTYFALTSNINPINDNFWIKNGLKSIPHGVCRD